MVVLVVRDARHRTQLYTPLVTIYYVRLLTGYKINGSAMDIAELFGFMPLANHLQNASRFLQLPPSPPPAQSGVKNGPSTSTPYINGLAASQPVIREAAKCTEAWITILSVQKEIIIHGNYTLLVLCIGHTPQRCMCCCPSPGQPNRPGLGPDLSFLCGI